MDAGVVPVVVAAMEAHVDNADVMFSACTVVCRLARVGASVWSRGAVVSWYCGMIGELPDGV